ncbi:MAG: ABC transporter ATP-binding protein [Prevotella sp.]|nr:ABC transporter ATP-binding protein [Prevotella sp.]MCM1075205.1 ABC transporter ATP-binding protein [Ruminococcus sp.]
MNSHSPVIELHNVSVSYDSRRPAALSDVNLTINRGDFLAISGPNGGGKTTMLRVILRLLKPTSGSVKYFDKSGHTVKRLQIGYLPQKSAVDTRFPITVRDVILSGLLTKLWSRPSHSDLKRLEEVVNLTGTSGFLTQSIDTLSGGQLQRTLLARAIISQPEVLVLDEPLSYVDKRFEQQIYGIVEELAKTATIILVSHEMSIISGMANRHIIVERTLHQCHALHHYIPGSTDCDLL